MICMLKNQMLQTTTDYKLKISIEIPEIQPKQVKLYFIASLLTSKFWKIANCEVWYT